MTAREFWKFKTMSSDGMTLDNLCAFAEAYADHVSPKAAEAPGGQDLETQQKDFALKMLNDDLEHSVSCMNRSCRRCNEIQRRFGPSQEAEGFSCQAAPAAPYDVLKESPVKFRHNGLEHQVDRMAQYVIDTHPGTSLTAAYRAVCEELANRARIRAGLSSQEGK